MLGTKECLGTRKAWGCGQLLVEHWAPPDSFRQRYTHSEHNLLSNLLRFVCIFNSSVKSVLLYGCETWRTTQTMQRKIQTFFNTCLTRIYKIQWQEKIRNEELWERAGQEPVAKQILRRKWGWIGHTLRKPASSTTRQALTWNPQGKRKRGRPRNSWRRDTEAELKQQGTSWSGMTRAAQNRVRWRGVVDGLCSTGSDGHK